LASQNIRFHFYENYFLSQTIIQKHLKVASYYLLAQNNVL
jgi:hypothetical protein